MAKGKVQYCNIHVTNIKKCCCRFAQIGVVSSGTGKTCIDGTGVYMKVSYYKKFIKKYAPEAMDANCKNI